MIAPRLRFVNGLNADILSFRAKFFARGHATSRLGERAPRSRFIPGRTAEKGTPHRGPFRPHTAAASFFELRIVQRGVETVPSQKFGMIALFHNVAVPEHEYQIGVAYRGQTVRY